MRQTTTTLLIVLLSVCLGSRAARGDRPGSYDNLDSRGSNRPTTYHPTANQNVPRGSFGQGWCQGGQRSSIGLYVGVPAPYFYSPVYGLDAYYPAGNYAAWGPYGIYYSPLLNVTEYYLPPTYMPAELGYGPQAVDRFLGLPRTPVLAVPPAAPVPDVSAEPKEASVASKLRKSNASAQERARRFLAFGDALFEQQRFHEAAQRYRSAIETAPDLPDAYYRQGFALLAVKQYRLAAKALRIAVELDPLMLQRDKLLHTLYGDNRLAKESHLEQLADRALAAPADGDLYFLVGVFLYANDEGERGARFLQRALDLSPTSTFLTPLLAPAKPSDARAEILELDT